MDVVGLAAAFGQLALAVQAVQAALLAEATPATSERPETVLTGPAPTRRPVPGTPRPIKQPWATPARVALIRERWPTYEASKSIYAAAATLDGPPLPRLTGWGVWIVQVLRLYRPLDFHSVTQRRVPAAVPPIEQPPATVAPAVASAIRSIVAASGKPIVASHATIQRWGAERGIVTGKLDLDRVNARRRALGLPPFEVETFQRTGA